MGFNSSSSTITLTAKLTPLGRKMLISNNNELITSFSLGDSDANYNAVYPLTTGQIPAEAGDIGPNASSSNSTTQNEALRSVLILNETGATKKAVESQSTTISSEITSNGITTISGNNLTYNIINRNNYATDSLVNLYYSFGLPVSSANDTNLTGVTYANGGYSNTALSGLAQSKILAISINNSTYGETIDGKAIKLVLPTSAGTFTIYSTFQNKGTSPRIEDTNYRDTSPVTASIGSNISFLFSDTIKTPNGGSGSLSWGTGFGTVKPFSVNGKRLYNLQTNSNLSASADTIVGVAYLDKGFLVITHPTIVNAFTSSASTATTVTFDSVSTSVFQNITCIANRGEFGTTTNSTFGPRDIPRISEVGLFDKTGNLIALAKTDRHITKIVSEFKALGIKISL